MSRFSVSFYDGQKMIGRFDLPDCFEYEDAHEAVLSIDDVHYAPPLWFERGLLGCDLGAEVLEGGQIGRALYNQ